jgi:hypothetical protein
MLGEIDLVIVSIIIDTIIFILASLSLWCILKIFDKLNKHSFKDNFERIENDNLGLAVYYGFRILALSILAATIYG